MPCCGKTDCVPDLPPAALSQYSSFFKTGKQNARNNHEIFMIAPGIFHFFISF